MWPLSVAPVPRHYSAFLGPRPILSFRVLCIPHTHHRQPKWTTGLPRCCQVNSAAGITITVHPNQAVLASLPNMETPSPGPEHEHFISWAKDQLGVTIDGVTPTKLPGRGLGVLATKPLKQGDLLVSVPAKSLLTIESKHVKDVRLPKEATVHGRLAAYLTLTSAKGDAPHRIWESVWPKKEEFEAIMPMNWEELQKELLPAHAKSRSCAPILILHDLRDPCFSSRSSAIIDHRTHLGQASSRSSKPSSK